MLIGVRLALHVSHTEMHIIKSLHPIFAARYKPSMLDLGKAHIPMRLHTKGLIANAQWNALACSTNLVLSHKKTERIQPSVSSLIRICLRK